MKNSSIHHEIIDSINQYDHDEYDYDDIIDQALKDKKYLFDALLNQFNDDDTSESESEDGSDREDGSADNDNN